MKIITKIIYIFIIPVLFLAGCNSNSDSAHENNTLAAADTGKAAISFVEYEHNFGKVESGEKVGCFFTYENTGNGNLIINSVSTICGCTVPKYEKKPLPPGNKGTLEVIFNTAGYNGIQTKSITVHSNAVQPVVLIKISAEVINGSQ